MKNQYVGDVGDYGKYGLLRYFANHGVRIGVNWYLTENDNSNDGRFTTYLEKPTERKYDPALYDALKEIAFLPNKSVQMIEKKGLIPGAVFYHEILKSAYDKPSAREINRILWFNNSKMLLGDAELIFADPDNGLTGKKTAKAKGSEKYVIPFEIADYYNSGKNVVYYCHKGRRKCDAWEETKLIMKKYVPDAQILVMTYHKGTQRSYIFVIHPDDYQKYVKLLSGFGRTKWSSVFNRESVGGKTPGQEILGEPLEVERSDGSILTLLKKMDGNIYITNSERPGETYVFTPDLLASLLSIW